MVIVADQDSQLGHNSNFETVVDVAPGLLTWSCVGDDGRLKRDQGLWLRATLLGSRI